MRLSFLGKTPIALAVIALLALSSQAQSQGQPQPQQPQQQAAPAPPKPYKAVTVRLPAPSTDASHAAFRKQLADIAKRKDRAALQKLVVTQNFFWQSADGDHADKTKSAFDNFATAIGLDGKEGYGWDWLAAAADEPTLEAVPEMKGVSCAPAGPVFDEKAFEEVVKATGTDEGEWVVTAAPSNDIRGAGNAKAPVIEKVGTILIRIMSDDQAAAAPAQENPFVMVVTPGGKVGYIAAEALSPLDFEQICYTKDGAAWKITGYFGGAPQ